MRLLNVHTHQLHDFPGADVPPYAILSHVWSSEEISYDEFVAGNRTDGYGRRKIAKLCELAQTGANLAALDWAWVDTCCIDKKSSAELSEAINSMYRWYERARVCFVFLPDVEPLEADQENVNDWYGVPFSEKQFLTSRWFRRGWTLQELIAPTQVLCFNTGYKIIGQKEATIGDHRPLAGLIEQASGIRISVLLGMLSANPRDVCIAQRMSWVSNRETIRAEDIAYCLLGLFDVNMPLIYGEGAQTAFLRLQTEIIARSTDDSILAWDYDPHAPQPWSGLLATSPNAFSNCRDMYTVRPEGPHLATTHTLTQRGIELTMSMDRGMWPKSKTTWCSLYPLSCFRLRAPWFRCHIKIWVENITMDGRNYADGSKLAWRSGILTIDSVDTRRIDVSRTQEVQAMRQALGWNEPNMLQFSPMERKLYDLINNESTMSRRIMGDILLKLPAFGLLKGQRVVSLYFKIRFSPGETPMATARLASDRTLNIGHTPESWSLPPRKTGLLRQRYRHASQR